MIDAVAVEQRSPRSLPVAACTTRRCPRPPRSPLGRHAPSSVPSCYSRDARRRSAARKATRRCRLRRALGGHERQHLVGGEIADGPRREAAQGDRPDPYAHQPRTGQLDGCKQPPHLSFAPLGHHERELRPVPARVHDPHRRGARRAVVELDPAPQARRDAWPSAFPPPRRGTPSRPRSADGSARSARSPSFVSSSSPSLSRSSRPTGNTRGPPRAGTPGCPDGPAGRRIVVTTPAGLWRAKYLTFGSRLTVDAVDGDTSSRRVDLVPERRDPPVDLHPARRDQLLAGSTRPEPRASERPLEALLGHPLALRPSGEAASVLGVLVGSGSSGRHRPRGRRRPPARRRHRAAARATAARPATADPRRSRNCGVVV